MFLKLTKAGSTKYVNENFALMIDLDLKEIFLTADAPSRRLFFDTVEIVEDFNG